MRQGTKGGTDSCPRSAIKHLHLQIFLLGFFSLCRSDVRRPLYLWPPHAAMVMKPIPAMMPLDFRLAWSFALNCAQRGRHPGATNNQSACCDPPRRSCIVHVSIVSFRRVSRGSKCCQKCIQARRNLWVTLKTPAKTQRRGGEMADTGDLKSPGRKAVRVRVPPAAPIRNVSPDSLRPMDFQTG